jgi:hypothetical protein
MSTLPDLNAGLKSDEAVEGLAVDILPSHGYVSELASTRRALGTISSKARALVSHDGFHPNNNSDQ